MTVESRDLTIGNAQEMHDNRSPHCKHLVADLGYRTLPSGAQIHLFHCYHCGQGASRLILNPAALVPIDHPSPDIRP